MPHYGNRDSDAHYKDNTTARQRAVYGGGEIRQTKGIKSCQWSLRGLSAQLTSSGRWKWSFYSQTLCFVYSECVVSHWISILFITIKAVQGTKSSLNDFLSTTSVLACDFLTHFTLKACIVYHQWNLASCFKLYHIIKGLFSVDTSAAAGWMMSATRDSAACGCTGWQQGEPVSKLCSDFGFSFCSFDQCFCHMKQLQQLWRGWRDVLFPLSHKAVSFFQRRMEECED